jgi:hypothetical protein
MWEDLEDIKGVIEGQTAQWPKEKGQNWVYTGLQRSGYWHGAVYMHMFKC